jgi:hypothetical protein
LSAANTVILYDTKPTKTGSVVPNPAEWSSGDASLWGTVAHRELSTPGGRADDLDTTVRCVNLWGVNIRTHLFAPSSFSFRLLRRTPWLPRWFVAGLIGPCGIYQHSLQPDAQWVDAKTGETAMTVLVPKLLWISDADTGLIRKNPAKAALLPLGEFFAQKDPHLSDAKSVWFAEAALFVRWGIYGEPDKPNHQTAFWKFLDRATGEPVTEDMFRECFGFGYLEMRSRLISYLPKAVDEIPRVQVGPAPEFDLPKPRIATEAEIARMVGDWERIKGVSLKTKNPVLSRQYLEEAGRTLMRAYAKGNRDPQFLGVLGLYEHAVGADSQARDFLEAAARGPIVRPSVYLTLAQLRFIEFKARPDGPDGRLGTRQIPEVLGPLSAARAQVPAMTATYRLIADAWAHSAAKPSREDLAVLDEGVRLFPPDSALADTASGLYAQWGYAREPFETDDRSSQK